MSNTCTSTGYLSIAFVLLFILVTVSCRQRSEELTGDQDTQSENQELYDRVMGVHDEVMPKMDDLYRAKSTLKKRLAETAGLSHAEKQKINARIALIDSASEGMMVWMRQFDPLPDSAGESKARAYLEGELEKVKKVREDILRALEATK
jgi:hypothetical protein